MSYPPPPGPFPPERPSDTSPSSGEYPVRSPFDNAAPPAQPPAQPLAQPPAQFGGPSSPFPQQPLYSQQPYGQQPYQQQPYQQPVPHGYQQFGYGAVAAPGRTNGLAVTSMVLGIVGIVLFCLYAIPSILAVIFGAVALNQFKTQPSVYTGRGMAIAGLVLGLIGVGILVLLLAVGSSLLTLSS